MRHRFALILAASIAGLFQPAALAAQSRDVEVRVRLESSDGTRLSGASWRSSGPWWTVAG